MHASFIAQLGRTEEARAAAEDLEARWEKMAGVNGTALVCVWAGLGETDRALDWLERVCGERDASLILLRTPWFGAVRSEPRLRQVEGVVGLPPAPSQSGA